MGKIKKYIEQALRATELADIEVKRRGIYRKPLVFDDDTKAMMNAIVISIKTMASK